MQRSKHLFQEGLHVFKTSPEFRMRALRYGDFQIKIKKQVYETTW